MKKSVKTHEEKGGKSGLGNRAAGSQKKTSAIHGTQKRASSKSKIKPKKWSGDVTEHSDALDLESKIFASGNARKIAVSLKRSAEKSNRRKAGPFQSAMSMLNFYINRGGKNLSAKEKKPLEAAKEELRKLFHKEENK